MSKRSVSIMAMLLLPAAGAASAGQFVLTAPGSWKASNTAAVTAAGGTLVWAHGPTGIGVATSDNANFLANLQAAGGFQSATADMMVQWVAPMPIEEFIGPSDDTFASLQWAPGAVDAPAAWAAGCTGAGARVAVIDGGIFAAHPDLAANVDVACSTSFVPGFPFNSDTGTFWHGTHVAGIIAAVDNTIGVVGIAPGATIVGVKALHSGSGSFGAVIGAILYASDPAAFGAPASCRADIINMSLGAEFPKNLAGAGPLVAAMSKANNYAASKGVLVISAAGNSGIDYGQAGNLIDVPGDSGSGLAISATGPLGWALGATDFRRPASYSNYGEGFVALAGPGGDFALPGSASCTMPLNPAGTITRPCWVFDLVLSTARGTTPAGTYAWAAGTSMATPAASAVAAIIKASHPGLSLGALKAALFQSADDEGKVGNDDFYGHGFVNALNGCTQ